MFHTSEWNRTQSEIKWIYRKMWGKIYVWFVDFGCSSFYGRCYCCCSSDNKNTYIFLCLLKGPLEYSALPFRIRLHTWLACTLLCLLYAYILDRLCDRRREQRDHCICVGQIVCARAPCTISIEMVCCCCSYCVLAAVDLVFFNEICMAFSVCECVFV